MTSREDLPLWGCYENIMTALQNYPIMPLDIPAPVRHLDCLREFVHLTDKVYHPYCLGRERIEDALDIACIANGLTREQLRTHACMYTVVNTSRHCALRGPCWRE